MFLQKCGEDIPFRYNMVVPVKGLVTFGVIIALYMVVAVFQYLPATEQLNVNVTNHMLVPVS